MSIEVSKLGNKEKTWTSKIEEFLRENKGKGFSTQEIREFIGFPHSHIRVILRSMEVKGKVRKGYHEGSVFFYLD